MAEVADAPGRFGFGVGFKAAQYLVCKAIHGELEGLRQNVTNKSG